MTLASMSVSEQQENFPVASLLLPASMRAAVQALYQFARYTDNVADDNSMPQDVRRRSLESVKRAITEARPELAPAITQEAIRAALHGEYNPRHLLALLNAFLWDVENKPITTQEALLEYCQHSAAPIGRAVLELHQEWHADITAADALCAAVQILNHIRDLREDVPQGRFYFPQEWFGNTSLQDALAQPHAPEVRAGINRALALVDNLLQQAARLPASLRGWRIRAEVLSILECARRWHGLLVSHNPLLETQNLRTKDKVAALWYGFAQSWRYQPARPRMQNRLKGSSFAVPILRMSDERKQAMVALYNLCHAIDDTVDHATHPQTARQQLAYWQEQIQMLYARNRVTLYPAVPEVRAMLPVVQRYHLPERLLLELLAGQVMDLSGAMVRPSLATLDNYCYRVASVVGLLSIKIFGCVDEQTEQFATHLGKALQIINILRDVREDAQRGRIYLPIELLEKAGIADITTDQIISGNKEQQARLRLVCQWLSAIAEDHFAKAETVMPLHPLERQRLQPALLMRRVYAHYLSRLQSYNWDSAHPAIRLGFLGKWRLGMQVLRG